jgi:hypothetical protein
MFVPLHMASCRVALLGGGNYLERETLTAWASSSTSPRQVQCGLVCVPRTAQDVTLGCGNMVNSNIIHGLGQ